MESRIEPAYLFEATFAESHVAARYVLRFCIGDQNMDRVARCLTDALSDRPIVGMC
jgi:hypothetical protein